jgi:hypothetical protein
MDGQRLWGRSSITHWTKPAHRSVVDQRPRPQFVSVLHMDHAWLHDYSRCRKLQHRAREPHMPSCLCVRWEGQPKTAGPCPVCHLTTSRSSRPSRRGLAHRKYLSADMFCHATLRFGVFDIIWLFASCLLRLAIRKAPVSLWQGTWWPQIDYPAICG